MIITVTPNPSVDRTLEIDELTHGAVLRATTSHVDPGGKGVNVARAVAANEHAAIALFPSGGAEGDHLASLLDAAGVHVTAVPISGSVRSNVALVEPDGTTTKINEQGPTLSTDEIKQLVETTAQAAETHGARWVALCGSLPPGAPDELYAQIVERLGALDVRVAVDTSGPPLGRAVDAGAGLVKPNREELEEVTGRTLSTLGDALE
ncbi:MAG: 1-phosphofructokinase family hexose kinase, partial [Egibacteraceae bacterium]